MKKRRVKLTPEDWKDAHLDIENNRLTTRDGRVFEDVEIEFNSLKRWLDENYKNKLQ
jgi:hypothetical protein